MPSSTHHSNPKQPSDTNQQRHAVVLGLISVMIFSLTLPFSKIVVQALSGFEVGLLRSLIGGIVALPILILTKSPRPNRQQLIQLYLASLGLIYGFPMLSAVAMQSVPVGHGAIVLAVLPLSTAVFGVMVSQKSMPMAFWIYAVLGSGLVLGYVLMTHSLQGFSVGDIFLAGAVLAAGFGYAHSGQLSTQMKGWQVICWALVLNLPVITGLTLF